MGINYSAQGADKRGNLWCRRGDVMLPKELGDKLYNIRYTLQRISQRCEKVQDQNIYYSCNSQRVFSLRGQGVSRVIPSTTFLACSLRCELQKKIASYNSAISLPTGVSRKLPSSDYFLIAFFVITGRQAKIITVVLSVAIGFLCLAVIISVLTCYAFKR